MVVAMWWLFFLPMAHAECPDAEPLVASAERALLGLQVEKAGVHLRDAENALACGPQPSPELLARYWLAFGVLGSSTGVGDPQEAFAHAHRVSPTTWTESYGPVFKDAWEAAGASHLGVAEVVVSPLPADGRVWLDGVRVGPMVSIWEGRHLVNVGWDEVVHLSRWVRLTSGERLTIPTGWVDPVESIEAKPKRKRHLAPLVVGLSAAALAGVSWGLAERERAAMSQYVGPSDALDATYQRHLAFSGLTVGLFGVAGGGVTLYIAL